MTIVALSLASLCIAALALVMTIVNLRLLRSPARWAGGRGGGGGGGGRGGRVPGAGERISVCIPARNEEPNLAACVHSVLANDHPDFEILLYDDQSTDATPRIIADLCARDRRVRAATPAPLPPGWNGKQHACWRMSREASGGWLLFLDADVRLAPDCLARARGAADELNAALVSMFPRQVTGSLAERLAVPMIFFILLSYLPFPQMRRTNRPSASAGCGQFLLVRRDAYDAGGGHERFKDSMHDGIRLPRAVRAAGFHSDLFDGTHLAHVRMYHGLASTWRGFTKNAYEGLGSLPLLVLLTITHLVGHVLPWIALPAAATLAMVQRSGRISDAANAHAVAGLLHPATVLACLLAVTLTIEQRTRIARRTGTSLGIVPLHPVAVLFMTAIQWWSWWLHVRGRRTWRGRGLTDSAGAPAATR